MMSRKKESVAIEGRLTSQNDVITTIKSCLDNRDFKYEYDHDRKLFMTAFKGNDLPISTNIIVTEVYIHFVLLLDINVPKDRYRDMVWNLNNINSSVVFGSFHLDEESGLVIFEYTFPYFKSEITKDFILYFIQIVVKTVDENDGYLKSLLNAS